MSDVRIVVRPHEREELREYFRALGEECSRCRYVAERAPDEVIDVVLIQSHERHVVDCGDVFDVWQEYGREEPAQRGLGKKTLALHTGILELLKKLPDSVSTRQVFYQCVSAEIVSNTKPDYDRVQRALVHMRRSGQVPFRRIVDRTRSKHQLASWDSCREILRAASVGFRLDAWREQPIVPMIACEKQALEGVFADVCDRFGVSLWVHRGFTSLSFEYEWSEAIRREIDRGKSVAIAYFGDHDPSGLAIERTTREKLASFGVKFTWERAALFDDDIDRFDLAELPVKRSDTRAKSFLSEFARCAELDALPPSELEQRIESAIDPYIDQARWDRIELEEEAQREGLETVAKHWDAALAAAKAA